MKTFEDVFSVLLHNYSSKKRNQLVSPFLLERDGRGFFLISHGLIDTKKAYKQKTCTTETILVFLRRKQVSLNQHETNIINYYRYAHALLVDSIGTN